MKKLFCLAALLVAAMGAKAQDGKLWVMPKVGMTTSTIVGDTPEQPDFTPGHGRIYWDFSTAVGWQAGVEVGQNFNQWLGWSAGVNYTKQRVRSHDDYRIFFHEYNDIHLVFHEINVPVMLTFHPVKGLAIEAGVQSGVTAEVKRSWVESGYDVIIPNGVYKEDGLDQFEKHPVSDKGSEHVKGHRVNTSIPIGASYTFRNVTLGVRYHWGITHVFDDVDMYSRYLSVTLGYRLPLGRSIK